MAIRSNDSALVMDRPVVTITGATGPRIGLTGPTGGQGDASPIGPTGATGDGGPIAVGPVGPTSITGSTGPRGDTGPVLSSNMTGATGWWGDWGASGPTGPVGPAGETGFTGPGGGPLGVTGLLGPTGSGSVCGVQSPSFFSPGIYLTAAPLLVNDLGSPYAFRYASANNIYLVPIFVPYARIYTEMAVESYVTNTLGFFRMGLYDCTEDMRPTVPLVDCGNRPVSAGMIVAAFSVALKQKPYYLAFWCNNNSIYFKYWGPEDVATTLGIRQSSFGDSWSQGINYLRYARTYGPVFPDLTLILPTALETGGTTIQGIR
jgi:hypothetical protein